MGEEAWGRPVWEDDAPGRRAADDLVAPVARAQDAVARLEASLEAASADVAQGLRARLALHEAAGVLAYRRMPVHPHDLALRAAGITGSYTAALLTGRLAQALPAGTRGTPDDWLVDRALDYARLWRRLAERTTWQPARDAGGMATLLAGLGERNADAATLAPWLDRLRQDRRAALLVAADALAHGLPDSERPGIGASFVAACVWRHAGYGSPASLPFWSAPLGRIEATRDGAALAWLACVTEAALRARRDLARLQDAERRAATLARTARSRVVAAAGVALREPVVTVAQLAAAVGVTTRAGQDLIGRLRDAGLLREVTGRSAWRAYVVA